MIQNYGAFFEKDGAGFRGQIKLTGFMNGDIDLSKSSWTYQVSIKKISALHSQLKFGSNLDLKCSFSKIWVPNYLILQKMHLLARI